MFTFCFFTNAPKVGFKVKKILKIVFQLLAFFNASCIALLDEDKKSMGKSCTNQHKLY